MKTIAQRYLMEHDAFGASLIHAVIKREQVEDKPKIIINTVNGGKGFNSYADFIDGVPTTNEHLASIINSDCNNDYFINNTLYIFTQNFEATREALRGVKLDFHMNFIVHGIKAN